MDYCVDSCIGRRLCISRCVTGVLVYHHRRMRRWHLTMRTNFKGQLGYWGRYGCITSIAIVTLFPFHVGRNEFEKKKGGLVSYPHCVLRWVQQRNWAKFLFLATVQQRLAHKSLSRFQHFLGSRKFFLCVCASGVVCVCRLAEFSLVFVFFCFISRLICLFRYTHAFENDTNVVTAGLVTIVYFSGAFVVSPFRPRFNVIQN